MKFHEKLKKIIKQSGISQKKIAEDTGLQEVTLSRWVTGRHIPRRPEFNVLEKYLGLPDNFLEDNIEINDPETALPENTIDYWRERAEKAEARLRALTDSHPAVEDIQELSADEYLDRLREAMRFVFNFITQDSAFRN